MSLKQTMPIETSYYRLGFDFATEETLSLEPVQQTVVLRERIKDLPDIKAQTEFLLGARDAGIDNYAAKLKKLLVNWSAGKPNGELAYLLRELNDWLYRKGILK